MATTTTSAPVTGPLTPDELAVIDLGVGWPKADLAEAVAIEEFQSGGNASEIGWDDNGATVADTTGTAVPSVPWSSYDTGEWQINSSSDPSGAPSVADPAWMTKMEDPGANSAQALAMFKARGWEPWKTASGLYAPADLTEGQTAANDVSRASPAQLDSAITWIEHNILENPLVSGPAGSVISTGAVDAGSFLSGGWQETALKIGAGLAGAALIVLGIYAAAKSPEPKQGGGLSPVKDAAKVAAL